MEITESEYLEHYGVKGMHWGVRTDREAKKDAKEFARAKEFYGEGAGTRRKLIKNSVESKKRKSKDYSDAFDHHLNNQDAAKHVSAAKRERRSKDTRKTAKRSLGSIARRATGEMGTAAAFTTVAVGGAVYLRSSHGKQMLSKTMRKINDLKSQRKHAKGAKWASAYIARNS